MYEGVPLYRKRRLYERLVAIRVSFVRIRRKARPQGRAGVLIEAKLP